MRVVILGAGVVGVATAWRLLCDGHDVTLIDRAEAPAQFTSFANAGLVAPGHAYAWASPAAPSIMLRSLWKADQSMRFRPQLSLDFWRWAIAFLGECNTESTTRNTSRKARLCAYSQTCLNETVEETGVTYDQNRGGLLYFYRTQSGFEAAAAKCQVLRDAGIDIEVLDRSGVVDRDPGLRAASGQIAGALFAPRDESGDARLFTEALAERCKDRGGLFRFDETIKQLDINGGRVSAVVTDKGRVSGDLYVLCLGIFSSALARQAGIRLPIYPVKGYSLTVAITDRERAPRIGGVDEDHLLAYCPMGDRLRLTATAELSGYSTNHKPADFAVMIDRAKALFPNAASFDHPQYWAGLRPMTPTGLPIIDRSPIENLWLNTGHGHMGWTMACGSAAILADLVGQRRPAIDLEGLAYET